MDINKLLILDECDELISNGLKDAGVTVDLATDVSTQKVLEMIKVS